MNDPTALTIATMLAWINDHRDEPLTLERIAARAGYSPFHFARLFAIWQLVLVLSQIWPFSD